MMRSSEILGFGHSVPKRRVNNDELETLFQLESGWIERRTGIKARYWAAAGDTLTNLAAAAGNAALEESAVNRDEIALTLLATSTPDQLLPPSAPLLAHKLGLKHSGAVDLAGACSGFLYALTLADSYVKAHRKPVLVVAANILSRRINMEERSSGVVFGDAAGAIVLSPSNEVRSGVIGADLASDGSQYNLIEIPAGGSSKPIGSDVSPQEFLMTMRDGKAVFSHAVNMMAQCSERAIAHAGLSAADISRFIPHQANVRIIDAVCEKLGIPKNKAIRTLESFGNSSAATIPLSMSLANRERPFIKGEHILMAAAGAGMTGGAVVLSIGA